MQKGDRDGRCSERGGKLCVVGESWDVNFPISPLHVSKDVANTYFPIHCEKHEVPHPKNCQLLPDFHFLHEIVKRALISFAIGVWKKLNSSLQYIYEVNKVNILHFATTRFSAQNNVCINSSVNYTQKLPKCPPINREEGIYGIFFLVCSLEMQMYMLTCKEFICLHARIRSLRSILFIPPEEELCCGALNKRTFLLHTVIKITNIIL